MGALAGHVKKLDVMQMAAGKLLGPLLVFLGTMVGHVNMLDAS